MAIKISRKNNTISNEYSGIINIIVFNGIVGADVIGIIMAISSSNFYAIF